jgi:hypothetical protein
VDIDHCVYATSSRLRGECLAWLCTKCLVDAYVDIFFKRIYFCCKHYERSLSSLLDTWVTMSQIANVIDGATLEGGGQSRILFAVVGQCRDATTKGCLSRGAVVDMSVFT